MNDVDQFLNLAKASASRALRVSEYEVVIFNSELYIVWFAKTLDNWKALVSTDILSGVYVEVTHNGAKNETYVDIYEKKSNHVLGPEDFND